MRRNADALASGTDGTSSCVFALDQDRLSLLRRIYMSAHCETCEPDPFHRRSFLKASGAITMAAALIGTTTFRSIAAAALTRAQRDKLSPDDILALMKNGNKRFYTGRRENQNF